MQGSLETEVPAGLQPMGQGAAVPATLRLLRAAEHFLACRDRALAVAPWAEPAPRTLAEAIARDFTGFDLERAEADFRAALAAFSAGSAPAMA